MTEEKLEEAVSEQEGVEIELDDPQSENVEQEVQTEAVSEESKAEEPDSELDDYGAKVQARIKKLTERYRKEERDREEAVRMAQQLLEENQKLKGQVQNLDRGYVSSEEGRINAQVETLKQQYRAAYESGDTDAMFAAQQNLSQLAVLQERLGSAKQRIERNQKSFQEQRIAPQQPVVPQPAPAQPDPRAQSWAEKNEWFGSDDAMTYAAFGIHRKLVEEEGFDPATDEYYNEVDRRIRAEFPHKFNTAKKTGGAQVAPAAASATRSTAKQGRRSVKLSPSQIAMAKRLNVPLEEYAKYVKD